MKNKPRCGEQRAQTFLLYDSLTVNLILDEQIQDILLTLRPRIAFLSSQKEKKQTNILISFDLELNE